LQLSVNAADYGKAGEGKSKARLELNKTIERDVEIYAAI
jgi:hypothetical protein